MRWTIRKGIGKREIIDSQGKICGYLICKPSVCEILDCAGHCVKRVAKEASLKIRIQGDGEERCATLCLAKDASFISLPRAESVTLPLEHSQLILRQLQDREYSVCQDAQEIGWVTGIAGHPQIMLTQRTTFDFAGLLYVLALWMYQEDDLEMV